MHNKLENFFKLVYNKAGCVYLFFTGREIIAMNIISAIINLFHHPITTIHAHYIGRNRSNIRAAWYIKLGTKMIEPFLQRASAIFSKSRASLSLSWYNSHSSRIRSAGFLYLAMVFPNVPLWFWRSQAP